MDPVERLIEAFNAPHQMIGMAYAIAITLFAVLCGGRTERFAGAAFIVGQFASTFSQDLSNWVDPQYRMFAIDLFMLALLVGLALRSHRTWTIFAAGFHLLAVLSHVAIAVDPTLRATAYAVVLNLLGYLVFLSLALGTLDAWRARRRERRHVTAMGASR
jgi:hypothetical protein